jgi:perosamine synthetase
LPPFDEIGFNYRMTDLQGALGLAQLERLDGFIAERAKLAEQYRKGLDELGWLRPPTAPEHQGHAWQAYVAVVEDGAPRTRDETMEFLQERGIATRPGTHAVTELAVYRNRFGLRPGQYPVASFLQDQTLALPLHNRMDSSDVERVLEALAALEP